LAAAVASGGHRLRAILGPPLMKRTDGLRFTPHSVHVCNEAADRSPAHVAWGRFCTQSGYKPATSFQCAAGFIARGNHHGHATPPSVSTPSRERGDQTTNLLESYVVRSPVVSTKRSSSFAADRSRGSSMDYRNAFDLTGSVAVISGGCAVSVRSLRRLA
jgi:hypothetical protein